MQPFEPDEALAPWFLEVLFREEDMVIPFIPPVGEFFAAIPDPELKVFIHAEVCPDPWQPTCLAWPSP